MKIRFPDKYSIIGDGGRVLASSADAILTEGTDISFDIKDGALIPRIKSRTEPVCFVSIKWCFRPEERRNERISVLGDTYERGYGDLEWHGVRWDRRMPWYFLVSNGTDAIRDYRGRLTEGFGVRVRPRAFCTWQYDQSGVTLHMDLRSGAIGVQLGERELDICDVIFTEHRDISAYNAARELCKSMSRNAIFPSAPVYGFNNWYYAYGKSNADDIRRDAAALAELTRGLATPYSLIDDGWQPNLTDGPWECGNERFPDIRALAGDIRAMGVIPGIWIRPLSQQKPCNNVPDFWRSTRDDGFLDPSLPEVIDYVKSCIRRLVDCGYGLIKYDFITYDIFGTWGFLCPNTITAGNWSFADRTRTSAEIVVDLYRAIREAAGDAVLIGCNTVSHLCVGFVEINRTGDDTSGIRWARTRKMGVNTLAFRSVQNGIFYMADADCAPITPSLDFTLNKKWVRLLAASGSPLFISRSPLSNSKEVTEEVRSALQRNSVQDDELIPLDWMENTCPARWLLNGEEIEIDWFGDGAPDDITHVMPYWSAPKK